MIRLKLKKKYPVRLKKRLRKKAGIRKKVYGTEETPRLSVFKSNRHIYAQIIDDDKMRTLSACSSLKVKLNKGEKPVALAKKVGLELGKESLKKKIHKVVFDRGGFIYHGRVKALAEGAREAGLKF